jgi:hypothetical protein
MFNLLSNQTKLLTFISNYTKSELEIVCTNLTRTIELLNISARELLANRRTYGVLLPQDDAVKTLSGEEPLMVIKAQLLLEQKNIISAINTLCLTEAIMVRDNFINCLDLISEQNDENEDKKNNEVEQKVAIAITSEQSTETIAVNEKSNVSPIRLTEIKQRLAQAVQVSSEKQNGIKNRLNQLLDNPTVSVSKITSKQA